MHVRFSAIGCRVRHTGSRPLVVLLETECKTGGGVASTHGKISSFAAVQKWLQPEWESEGSHKPLLYILHPGCESDLPDLQWQGSILTGEVWGLTGSNLADSTHPHCGWHGL